MVIDDSGFRLNVGIVLSNKERYLFWGRRIGHDTWQFPQGGIAPGESPEDTLFRELKEEVGLDKPDVTILASTKTWLEYTLPEQYQRRNTRPAVLGQKQKWFLLQLNCPEQKIKLDASDSPEFDSWRWVEFWQPVQEVIYFKRDVYKTMLKEFEPILRSKTVIKE